MRTYYGWGDGFRLHSGKFMPKITVFKSEKVYFRKCCLISYEDHMQ